MYVLYLYRVLERNSWWCRAGIQNRKSSERFVQSELVEVIQVWKVWIWKPRKNLNDIVYDVIYDIVYYIILYRIRHRMRCWKSYIVYDVVYDIVCQPTMSYTISRNVRHRRSHRRSRYCSCQSYVRHRTSHRIRCRMSNLRHRIRFCVFVRHRRWEDCSCQSYVTTSYTIS